ncbi:tyrosine-type recombinase/integrase [Lentisalinibacter orientalis]|uniref:tyrosine-type recombinase/integrase n=1 Tax=Lentisalinibacter orientalis TaxID=2992241 RepID=UPI00386CB5F6
MRIPRNGVLERKAERLELPSKKRHWVRLAPGISLGYYRPNRRSVAGTWYLRKRNGNRNETTKLAIADDYQDANCQSILSYRQAVEFAFRPPDTIASRTTRPGGATLKEAAKEYMADYKARSGKATAELQRVLDRDILPFLGDTHLSDLDRSSLTRWRNSMVKKLPRKRNGEPRPIDLEDPDIKRRRRATAERKFTLLKAVLNFARAEGMVDSDNAWGSIRPFRNIDAPSREFLTLDQCRSLVNGADEEFRPLLEATFLTGCAWSELIRLRVRDYFSDTKHLRVYNSKRQSRLVPLTPDGANLFARAGGDRHGDSPMFLRAGGESWAKGMQHRRMAEAVERAGLNRHITLTDVRSAYGSIMLNAGARLETVSRAMGHSSIHVTAKHYARLLQSTIDAEVRASLPSLRADEDAVAASGTGVPLPDERLRN